MVPFCASTVYSYSVPFAKKSISYSQRPSSRSSSSWVKVAAEAETPASCRTASFAFSSPISEAEPDDVLPEPEEDVPEPVKAGGAAVSLSFERMEPVAASMSYSYLPEAVKNSISYSQRPSS